MNSIEAVLRVSSFDEEESLMILIDGTPLDTLLSAASPDDQLEGLVPALLPLTADDQDQSLVWSRFLPADEVRVRAPVLVCPEHRDLFCTTIVAEVRVVGNQVEWRRVGIDDTPEEDLPDLVGQDVYWIPEVGPYVFDRAEYQRLVTAFREQSVPGGTLH